MILQLNPSIPVNTPKGTGEAILIIDYGVEHDLLFTVFLDETGQCWTFGNKEIRAIKNISIGRKNVDDPNVEHSIVTNKDCDIKLNGDLSKFEVKWEELCAKVEEVNVGGVKIVTDPSMKPGTYAIYGDQDGHTAKAVKGLCEMVKERNAWINNADLFRSSQELEEATKKLKDHMETMTKAEKRSVFKNLFRGYE